MDAWNNIRWTEAVQITAFMELDPADQPAPDVAPAAFFADLKAKGRIEDALDFLGLALPRLEALHWAAAVLAEEARDRRLTTADRQALDQSLRWLDAPSDGHRRAAFQAGQNAAPRAPERALTLAIFFSGGSISEPQLPPVLPAPDLTGRYAAGAVRMAAHRSDHARAVQQRALDLGARVAADGIAVLSPA